MVRLISAIAVATVVLTACREAPPYIDPTRYQQAGQTTPGRAPKIFAAALPAGEPLPADATADALQLGWFCLDLPDQPRPRLLPGRGDGRLRVVQADGRGGWEVAAVDLAARSATRETALDSAADWPASDGFVTRVGPAAESTATRADLTDGLLPMPTDPTPVAWLIWRTEAVETTLAPDATHVTGLAVDDAGAILAFVDAAPGATPTLWAVALAGEATPMQVGLAHHIWALVGDGTTALVRGVGPLGPQTQWMSLPDGATRAIGPDGRAVVAVDRGVLIETDQGALVRVDIDTGIQHRLGPTGSSARLLTQGGQPAVALADAPSETTLFWFDGRGLRRVTRIGPARWLAAVPMQGPVIAALVGWDPPGGRPFDPLVDPARVCVVARAVGALRMERPAPWSTRQP